MALAVVAAGADGVMLDVHPEPGTARCDGPQALLPRELAPLGAKLRELTRWIGRDVGEALDTATTFDKGVDAP
jgi:3-deoxy-7-phosphoheptulonate synthase